MVTFSNADKSSSAFWAIVGGDEKDAKPPDVGPIRHPSSISPSKSLSILSLHNSIDGLIIPKFTRHSIMAEICCVVMPGTCCKAAITDEVDVGISDSQY